MKTGLLALILCLALGSVRAQDPLPSWNETAPKKAIVAFVEKVTKVSMKNDWKTIFPVAVQ